ncbi:hypothetical protein SARC_15297 [Sphaeroforma arctica JP610]|uniref:Uncharacterized protein n=1 Tax=Sphaeroforma arctica JP610 TaxID=667725 RepID=A0A0L0F7Q2_9EUKA|nr:hypothetical protein SARC_15297 [Sphaeroforma arctica JP610]KNC72153.1 hypothetical protein SARC_15297 [Sphaeroforma arctica JP610]|eukprot:XP_014146055.1 hypothetical protein SARC_15297 [Sphaeroforma arctica JP610]
MNLHVRAMALPNVHFNDYQSITVAYKYDGEWAGNHFGQVWDKLQRHPEYTPEFPLLVGQAPLEAYTVLVQGVPDAR